MKKINATLARAHKITERLGAQIAAKRVVIANGRATSFDMRPTAEQREAFSQNVAAAVTALNEITYLMTVQAQLRNVIGLANANHGVVEALGQIARTKHLLKVYDEALDKLTPDADEVHISALGQIEWPDRGVARYGSGVKVTGIDTETVSRLKIERDRLEKELFALQDDLSDRNATRIELSLPEDVADDLGL